MNAQQRRKAKRKNHYSEIVEKFLAEENNQFPDHKFNIIWLDEIDQYSTEEKVNLIKEKDPKYFEENKEEILENARALEFWTEKEKELLDTQPKLVLADFDEDNNIKSIRYVEKDEPIMYTEPKSTVFSDEQELKESGLFTKIKKFFKGAK